MPSPPRGTARSSAIPIRHGQEASTNTFSLQSLSLRIFIQTVQGIMKNNQYYDNADQSGAINLPGIRRLLDRCNHNNSRPSLAYTNPYNYAYPSKANFTRLKDLACGTDSAQCLVVYGGPQKICRHPARRAQRPSSESSYSSCREAEPAATALPSEPHCWSRVLPPDKFSFPSGHTMTAFSIALVVSYFYPSLEGMLFFVAFSIAVSRIVLGMHFLSDVLAGIVLGVALGCASITALLPLAWFKR